MLSSSVYTVVLILHLNVKSLHNLAINVISVRDLGLLSRPEKLQILGEHFSVTQDQTYIPLIHVH